MNDRWALLVHSQTNYHFQKLKADRMYSPRPELPLFYYRHFKRVFLLLLSFFSPLVVVAHVRWNKYFFNLSDFVIEMDSHPSPRKRFATRIICKQFMALHVALMWIYSVKQKLQDRKFEQLILVFLFVCVCRCITICSLLYQRIRSLHYFRR